MPQHFLSHLCGDEDIRYSYCSACTFLSHLCGDEEELYLKKVSYAKAWRAKYPNLPSIFYLVVTV